MSRDIYLYFFFCNPMLSEADDGLVFNVLLQFQGTKKYRMNSQVAISVAILISRVPQVAVGICLYELNPSCS